MAGLLAVVEWLQLSMAAAVGVAESIALVGVAESIALVGVGLTVLGFAGSTVSSGVKALWAISKGLGAFEGKIMEVLSRHKSVLKDHEERLRAGKL
jgi:hypothetical protein